MKTYRVPVLVVATVVTVLIPGGLSAQSIAKVNYIEGEASLQSGGKADWLEVKPGDRVNVTDNFWVDQNSRAELLMDALIIRINSETSLTLESAQENSIQFKLWLGSMIVRFSGDPGQQISVRTPNLRFALNQPGEYRLDVNAAGDETIATVWSGEAESTGGGARYVVHASERAELRGTDKVELEVKPASTTDDFDQWAFRRDQMVGPASANGEPRGTDAGSTESGDGNANAPPDDSRDTQATLWPLPCSRPWCELDAYPSLQWEVYAGLDVWWRGLPCDPIACRVIFSNVAVPPVDPGLRRAVLSPQQRPRPLPSSDQAQGTPDALPVARAHEESRVNRDTGTHQTAGPTEPPDNNESNSNRPIAKAHDEVTRPGSADNTRQSAGDHAKADPFEAAKNSVAARGSTQPEQKSPGTSPIR